METKVFSVTNFLEHSVKRELQKVIDSLERKPQLNTVGIKQELESIVLPNGHDPVGGPIQLPQIYTEIREYYNQIRAAVDKGEAFHNQTGALHFLNGVKQKYY